MSFCPEHGHKTELISCLYVFMVLGARLLTRSKTILTGTLGEALSSSHNDPCNVCARGN